MATVQWLSPLEPSMMQTLGRPNSRVHSQRMGLWTVFKAPVWPGYIYSSCSQTASHWFHLSTKQMQTNLPWDANVCWYVWIRSTSSHELSMHVPSKDLVVADSRKSNSNWEIGRWRSGSICCGSDDGDTHNWWEAWAYQESYCRRCTAIWHHQAHQDTQARVHQRCPRAPKIHVWALGTCLCSWRSPAVSIKSGHQSHTTTKDGGSNTWWVSRNDKISGKCQDTHLVAWYDQWDQKERVQGWWLELSTADCTYASPTLAESHNWPLSTSWSAIPHHHRLLLQILGDCISNDQHSHSVHEADEGHVCQMGVYSRGTCLRQQSSVCISRVQRLQRTHTHTTWSPPYPQANGEAEKGFHTAKKFLAQKDPYLALLSYWAIPIAATGHSSAQLIIGSQIRTIVPSLTHNLEPGWLDFKKVKQCHVSAKASYRLFYDHHNSPQELLPLIPGDQVRLKPPSQKTWQKTQLTVVSGQNRSDVLQYPDGATFHHNQKHLQKVLDDGSGAAAGLSINYPDDELPVDI